MTRIAESGLNPTCKRAVILAVLVISILEIYYVSKLERGSAVQPYRSGPQHSIGDYTFEMTMESDTELSAPVQQQSGEASILSNPREVIGNGTVKPSHSQLNESQIEAEISRRLAAATDKKIILIWSLAFGNKDAHSENPKICGNCEITYDRSLISDERTGAAVFHFDSIRGNDMPTPRNLNQLHIFWDMESSATLKVARRLSLSFEDSYKFNATMTHRLDSAFFASYQSANLADSQMGKNVSIYEDVLSRKSKFAIAMISNCGYTNGARVRLTKIKELIRLGLKMDGFGNCFNKKISWKQVPETVAKYKFYFSFENSYHCKDYVTEKFFNNALRNRAVPVVWGATKQDYEKIAPPGSFIFAEDFDTPQKLIDYLSFLDKNDTEYLKYFKWLTMKPEMLPQYKRIRGFCAICRALHGINADERFSPKFDRSNPSVPLFSDGIYPRVVPSLIKWFYGEDNPECFN